MFTNDLRYNAIFIYVAFFGSGKGRWARSEARITRPVKRTDTVAAAGSGRTRMNVRSDAGDVCSSTDAAATAAVVGGGRNTSW